MTSIQQLFQLSVAITFNFLGTCFLPRGRGMRIEKGGWDAVRVESGLNERFLFSWVGRPDVAWWFSGVRDPSLLIKVQQI